MIIFSGAVILFCAALLGICLWGLALALVDLVMTLRVLFLGG